MTSGAFRQSSARATRAFCPPDKSFMRIVCAWPASPKVPSCLRAFSYGRSNNRIRYSAGVSSAVKCSPECWSNFPSFCEKCVCDDLRFLSIYQRVFVCINTIRWFIRISPSLGCKSPVKSLRNVDFPTPLGPTIATRELRSTPKSTFLNNGFWEGYAKLTPMQLNDEHIINWWHFILSYNIMSSELGYWRRLTVKTQYRRL